MTSILDPKEVNRARVGPSGQKDPRSREYAIQTLYSLKRHAESLRYDQNLIEEELKRIEEYQHWKVLGYPSMPAMLAAELNETGLENVTRTQQVMAEAGTLAKQEIGAGKPGPGRGKKTGDNITRLRGDSVSYLASRLKRDHPEIAARVERGEFRSMRAAAIEAGIVKPRISVELSVRGMIKACRKLTAAEREQVKSAI